MAVSALMQIPFLAAIIAHIVTVVKLLWELIGKAAKQVAVWAAFFIPWLTRQAAQSIANRIIIASVWYAILLFIWRGIVSLAGMFVSATVPWSQIAVESNVIVSWIWDSPFHLQRGFTQLLPTLLAAQTSAYSLRILYRKLSWAVLVNKTSQSV